MVIQHPRNGTTQQLVLAAAISSTKHAAGRHYVLAWAITRTVMFMAFNPREAEQHTEQSFRRSGMELDQLVEMFGGASKGKPAMWQHVLNERAPDLSWYDQC